jgi:hypothetical protein
VPFIDSISHFMNGLFFMPCIHAAGIIIIFHDFGKILYVTGSSPVSRTIFFTLSKRYNKNTSNFKNPFLNLL